VVLQVGSGLDNDERKIVHDQLAPLVEENSGKHTPPSCLR